MDRRTKLLYQYLASVCWRAIKKIGCRRWKKIQDLYNHLDRIPSVSDRRQTDILPLLSPRYAYASRGKNAKIVFDRYCSANSAIYFCIHQCSNSVDRLACLTDFQNAVACKGYTSVLSKMVQVIFAVLGVSFWALTTVVKLPWKVLALIFAVLLPFFCCAMLCKRGFSRHAVSVRLSARVSCHVPTCILSKRIYISSYFLPSVSHTILIFPYQTL